MLLPPSSTQAKFRIIAYSLLRWTSHNPKKFNIYFMPNAPHQVVRNNLPYMDLEVNVSFN